MKTHTLVCSITTMLIVCMCVSKREGRKLWLGKKAILTGPEYKIEITQTIRKERNGSR